jgi:hypothetical protein
MRTLIHQSATSRHFTQLNCWQVATELSHQQANSLYSTKLLITDCTHSQSQSHIATDDQSVSLSVMVSSPVWGSWPDISYCVTVTVLYLGGRPLWREDGSVVCQSVSSIRSIVSMYSYNFYILHVSLVIEYIYNIYTRPLLVRAQYSRLCPISGSFPITAV